MDKGHLNKNLNKESFMSVYHYLMFLNQLKKRRKILLELHINLTFTIQHCHNSLSNNKTTIEANLEPFFVAQWLAILTNGAMWRSG